MKSLSHLLAAIIIVLFYSCSDRSHETSYVFEPQDPEGINSGLWSSTGTGLRSGFGNTDTRYSRSKPPGGRLSDSIVLTGWKGEKVHCQLLFWSATDQGTVSVRAVLTDNDNQLIQDNILLRTVKYVLADEFLNGCGRRDKDTIRSHLVPDMLDDTNTFYLEGMQTRPVWISIMIPPGCDPGIYNLQVTGVSQTDTVNHMVSITVQDRLLPPPDTWSFHLDLWQNPFAVARYNGVQLWSQEHNDLLRPLFRMLAEAGQKCITASITDRPWGGQTFDPFQNMITWIKNTDGYWDYDYSVFDQYVQLAIDCGIDRQINCYSMVPWNNSYIYFDQDSGRHITMEAIPGSEEYNDLWRSFLGDFKAHLMEMGWFEKATIAVDERDHKQMKAMFSLLNDVSPDFKVTMAGNYFEDLSMHIHDFSFNWWNISDDIQGKVDKRKAMNQLSTFYVACGIEEPNTFTFSPPAEATYLGWFAAAMGFDGFLRWAYNSWPENPVYDSRFITWPSGDTYLVYPGARSSIRLEKLTEGIQDYEKIRILKQELSLNPSMEAAAAEERIKHFLSEINTTTLDSLPASDIIGRGKQMLEEISRIKQ